MEIDTHRRNKKPRPLLENERDKLEEFVDSIHYSARWGHNDPTLDFFAHPQQ